MEAAVNQIIRAILESDEGFAKSKQAANAANPGSGGGSSEPSSKATEVLAAPGIETLDKAANATSKATPPGNDPKAKAGAGSKLTEEDDAEKKEFPFNNKKKDSEDDDDDEDDDKKKKDDDKSDDDDKDDKKKVEEEIDVTEHMTALFDGETLSEDFKAKAETIFRAALAEQLAVKQTQLTEDYEEAIVAGLDETKVELAERLDSYLDYVVGEFMTENALQIERGLKLEITESFLTGLKGLFESHNIEVPDAKVDVLGELTDQIEVLKNKLNEEVNRNVEMKKEVVNYKKAELIAEAGEGLAATDYEKFVNLCESVTTDSTEAMKKKIGTIKESYFTKKGTGSTGTKTLTEDQQIGDEFEETTNSDGSAPEVISEEMQRLAAAVGKYGKR